MKVKKYVATTMPEILKDIRADLGSDAVILNSKEVRHGGLLGFFKKSKIEVIAALDPQPLAPKPNHHDEKNKIQSIAEESVSQTNNSTNSAILNEIKHMKKIVEQQAIQSDNGYLPGYQLAHQYLLDQEVNEQFAKWIIDGVVKQHERNKTTPTPEQIIQAVRLEIEKRLSELSFQEITSRQKIIHFVGPTGVGKTTTLAKVAANGMLKDHKKIAFITTDTYRIAAIDQLKTFARILDVPIEVAYTIEDYHNALHQFAAYDFILVDTAGRNFRDEKYVSELQKSIGLDSKVYLVLSLTAKPKDITEIYDQFSHLPIKEVIFTKLDETRQYGSILNVALANQIEVAYLTNGQEVPDDLIQPTPQKISDYIIAGYFDE